MRDLAAMHIVAGDCGAASLAALRALVRDPLCEPLARAAGLGRTSRVLLFRPRARRSPLLR